MAEISDIHGNHKDYHILCLFYNIPVHAKADGGTISVVAEGEIEVLKGLSFTVEEQEFVGIMGRSGSGKTTLLRTLGLIDEPTGRELLMWGKTAVTMPERDAADLRRTKIGMIFQDYFLMETLTVRENIMLPMALNGCKREEMDDALKEYASVFGIESLLDKYPMRYQAARSRRRPYAVR